MHNENHNLRNQPGSAAQSSCSGYYYLRMLHREGLPQVSKGMTREIVTTFGVLDELNDQIEQMIESGHGAGEDIEMRKITLQQLKDVGACASQVCEFKKRFGDSVEVTEDLCLAVFDVFDFDFAARSLLSAPALAEYEKVCAPAWAEYEKVCDAALAEYEKVRAPALAEYEKVRAPAWAEYEKVRAITFARLYIADEA